MNNYSLYIIGSLNKPKTYVGFSSDFKKRLDKHNQGEVPFTSRFVPWKLLYIESGLNKADAMKREKYFKSSASLPKIS